MREAARLAPLLTVLVAIGLWVAVPVEAAKREIRKVCAPKTVVHSTHSGGFTVATLKRGDRVILIKRQGKLAYVISGNGQGWMLAKAICPNRFGKRKRRSAKRSNARLVAETRERHV